MEINGIPVHLHEGDLPAGLDFGDSLAIDTETMGLDPQRDRLCLVQMRGRDGDVHLVKFQGRVYDAPNLKAVLSNPEIVKIFHFARFDLSMLYRYLGVACSPVYCTKVASKLVRTYTDRHGLKDLCREVLGVELDKEQQSSDWGADSLSEQQMRYAASDVVHLHALRDELDRRLQREQRTALATACFAFLPHRALLDLGGWAEPDLFSH